MPEPRTPTDLSGRSWKGVLRRTLRGFGKDNLTDWAAALTYYAVLSLFPAIIVVTSLTALLGPSATESLVESITAIAPGEAGSILTGAVEELQGSAGIAGPLAIIGLLGALWTASGYIGAFMRASNSIYEMPEGRPIWKTLPLRVGLTLGISVLLAVCAAAVVATGEIAERIGAAIGIGSTGLLVWSIAKWPAVALLVSLAIALLYWTAPNVRQPKLRWLSPGGIVAVLVWAIASAAFAFYVANFGSYNKTYGSLGGVIGFLVWLWISNLAILLGAELDAELARSRAMAGGADEDQEPFLPPRDTRSMDDEEKADLDGRA
jgi:membrane protein